MQEFLALHGVVVDGVLALGVREVLHLHRGAILRAREHAVREPLHFPLHFLAAAGRHVALRGAARRRISCMHGGACALLVRGGTLIAGVIVAGPFPGVGVDLDRLSVVPGARLITLSEA